MPAANLPSLSFLLMLLLISTGCDKTKPAAPPLPDAGTLEQPQQDPKALSIELAQLAAAIRDAFADPATLTRKSHLMQEKEFIQHYAARLEKWMKEAGYSHPLRPPCESLQHNMSFTAEGIREINATEPEVEGARLNKDRARFSHKADDLFRMATSY